MNPARLYTARQVQPAPIRWWEWLVCRAVPDDLTPLLAVPGREVYEELVRATGRDVAVTAVYVTLNRLQKKGFVSAEMGEATPERGGRAKKLFRLEPEGAEALKSSRAQLEQLWRAARSHPQLCG